jgi:hypothetical protein
MKFNCEVEWHDGAKWYEPEVTYDIPEAEANKIKAEDCLKFFTPLDDDARKLAGVEQAQPEQTDPTVLKALKDEAKTLKIKDYDTMDADALAKAITAAKGAK